MSDICGRARRGSDQGQRHRRRDPRGLFCGAYGRYCTKPCMCVRTMGSASRHDIFASSCSPCFFCNIPALGARSLGVKYHSLIGRASIERTGRLISTSQLTNIPSDLHGRVEPQNLCKRTCKLRPSKHTFREAHTVQESSQIFHFSDILVCRHVIGSDFF